MYCNVKNAPLSQMDIGLNDLFCLTGSESALQVKYEFG